MLRNPMGAETGHGWWIWEDTPSGLGGIILSKSIHMPIGPYLSPKTHQTLERYSPSTDWGHGGSIIERERISTDLDFLEFTEAKTKWAAWAPARHRDSAEYFGYGSTPLIAAMRAYVASKLGDEVEIPASLTPKEHL